MRRYPTRKKIDYPTAWGETKAHCPKCVSLQDVLARRTTPQHAQYRCKTCWKLWAGPWRWRREAPDAE